MQQQIPRIVAALQGDPLYDPIMRDLLKIEGRSLPTMEEEQAERRHRVGLPLPDQREDAGHVHTAPTLPQDLLGGVLVEDHLLKLMELLELLSLPKIDDSTRSGYEYSLKELISHTPRLKPGPRKYPNDYLSRILIDNYKLILKFSTLYFNLSLASLVTRYLVSLVYLLQCWEIYHLLYVVPNLEYIFQLLGFDIKLTPLGFAVRPPENFLDYNLRQGLQYPFPFPFYNFSYHAIDPTAADSKWKRISIAPYVDIRLKTQPKKKVRVPRAEPTPPALTSTVAAPPPPPSRELVKPAKPTKKDDFQRQKKVYMFMELTPAQIQRDYETEVPVPDYAIDDDGYDSALALALEREEDSKADRSGPITIIPSQFTRELQEKKGLYRFASVHQCTLGDPATGLCMKVFYGKSELHRHQEFVHATKKRNYRCIFCLRNEGSTQCYPRHDSLARHIRRKHGITGKENKLAVLHAREDAEAEEKQTDADFVSGHPDSNFVPGHPKSADASKQAAKEGAPPRAPEPVTATRPPDQTYILPSQAAPVAKPEHVSTPPNAAAPIIHVLSPPNMAAQPVSVPSGAPARMARGLVSSVPGPLPVQGPLPAVLELTFPTSSRQHKRKPSSQSVQGDREHSANPSPKKSQVWQDPASMGQSPLFSVANTFPKPAELRPMGNVEGGFQPYPDVSRWGPAQGMYGQNPPDEKSGAMQQAFYPYPMPGYPPVYHQDGQYYGMPFMMNRGPQPQFGNGMYPPYGQGSGHPGDGRMYPQQEMYMSQNARYPPESQQEGQPRRQEHQGNR